MGLTLIAAFSLNLDSPTPAQAALVASLGACCKAKVAYSLALYAGTSVDHVDERATAKEITEALALALT